jgi:hypothetical protein
MNQQIRKLAVGMLALYMALFAMLNVVQVGQKEALNANPQNNRQTIRDFNRMRGAIVTADGTVVARSVPTTGDSQFKYQREYPTGELFSNITGYYTYSFGSSQLEKTQNDVLMGDTTQQKVDSVLGGADNSGSVQLTLRADVQRIAAQALGLQRCTGREGTVVVMNPTTGAVIAMVSYPWYNPNQVATHDSKAAENVFNFLNNTPGKPLLANAYQENYMPGSAFKVITTGIALENGFTSLDRSWPNEREWVPPQTERPHPELRREQLRRQHGAGLLSQLQHPLRAARHRDGPADDDRRRCPLGHRRARAHRPPRRRGQQLLRQRHPVRRELLREPVAAELHRWLRAGQRPDGAAAHVHGGRHRRQRRPDDDAVRGGCDAQARRVGAQAHRPRRCGRRPSRRSPPAR